MSTILFYCKDCKSVVDDSKRKGKKYEYNCPICGGDKVVFGSQASICDYFQIKESMLEKMLKT